MPLTIPKPNPSYTWKLESISGGVNYADLEYKLADSQSPKAVNVWFNNRILCKRWGQTNLNTAIGTPILAAYPFKFNGKFVFASGTQLYTADTGTGTVTSIYTGLTAQKGSFFKFNSKLYYINGVQYVQYDGTTVTAVVPYIPEVIQDRLPTGGGNTNEQYNRLGAGIKNSFSSDGTSVAYTLTDTNLDATAITASTDYGANYNKVETTDFTVNRITGIVTWTAAPPSGTNRTKIKFYKTNQTDINSILNCKYAIPFGGQNDNRVFFAGNGTGYVYWTGISTAGIDPTYWAYNNYNIYGNPDDNIYGFGKSYETLVVFKAREMYGVTYSWNGTTGVFDSKTLNGSIGCDCPGTIQIINSNLTWCNTYGGVYTIIGTQVMTQREVYPLSRNINGNTQRPGLLQETNLTNAISIDFQQKYWIAVNGHVYLWDYGVSPYQANSDLDVAQQKLSWWYWDSVPVSCFMQDAGSLYYGDNTSGYIAQFVNTYTDFSTQAINSLWRMPLRDLGYPNMLKTIIEVWFSCRTDTYTKINIKYITEQSPNGDIDSQSIIASSFSWATFRWDLFTWMVINFMKTFRRKINKKKILLFAVELSNNDVGRDMSVSNLMFNFTVDKIIK